MKVMPSPMRQEVCMRLGIAHKRLAENYVSAVGLDEPPGASFKTILSEGAGKCWFSSVFYLFTGKKWLVTLEINCNTSVKASRDKKILILFR